MGVKKQKVQDSNLDQQLENSAQKKVERTLTQEIVIGICSPIGCDKYKVMDYLKDRLKNDYGYKVIEIKLSDFLESKFVDFKNFHFKPPRNCSEKFEEYLEKIERGNFLRNYYNSNSVLAELAVEKILSSRVSGKNLSKKSGNETGPVWESRRYCYIINSIKHKDELTLLRSIYRESFYMFSIYSPMNDREKLMLDRNFSKKEFSNIANIDLEEDEDYGQKVIKVFQEADFFLRVDSYTSQNLLQQRIDRYCHLIFGSQIATPTSGETAMYQAKSAACNSACLSRQVGAAITSASGSVLSTGWNDVPKYQGGLYKEGGGKDNRCVNVGNQCMNSYTKNSIISNLVEKLVAEGLVENKNTLIAKAVIAKTEIADLTEFSRAVHAEMHAIIQGAQQSGDKMKGGKLYCTTYPCHNCARHIVVAGIEEIYYIEPYKKSRCLELHNDTMTENEEDKGKVKILMFDGVSPNRYLEFFKAGSRKDKKTGAGHSLGDLSKAKPRNMLSLEALPTLESQAVISLRAMGLTAKS